MAMNPPDIDTRTYEQLIEQTETLAKQWAGWVPPPEGHTDAGRALIHIFAKMSHLVIARLNQVPEKNFLAFLDLIGTHILPPQPARVPLTFGLAPKSPEARLVPIPAGTQISAPPPEGEAEEVVFETDQDLGVTSARLTRIIVHQPEADQFALFFPGEQISSPFPAFEGNRPIDHSLYLANDDWLLLPESKTVRIIITSPEVPRLKALPMQWTYWNGEAWTSLHPFLQRSQVQGTKWLLTFVRMPRPSLKLVNGQTAAWIRASLTTPLSPTQVRQDQQPLPASHSGEQELDVTHPFFPFGPTGETKTWDLYLEPVLAHLPDSMREIGGTTVTLDVTVTKPGTASSTLILTWEYFLGEGSWKTLGQTGPQVSNSPLRDETKAFTQNGAVSFSLPAEQPREALHGRPGRWLRIRITKGQYGRGRNAKPPHLQHLNIGYAWKLPTIDQISAQVALTQTGQPLQKGITNTQPISVEKDFFPFGERPRFNDTLYLALHPEFAQPGVRVTLRLTLSSPHPHPIRASRDLALGWEVHTVNGWTPIPGINASHPDVLKCVRSGMLTFTLPPDTTTFSIQNETGLWIRARILQGNYGVEATFAPVTITINGKNVTSYQPVPATFGSPSIQSITFDYRVTPSGALKQCLTDNDFSYQDHTALAGQADGRLFEPFTPSEERRPALYLGFDRPFTNRLVTLYAGMDSPQPGEVGSRQSTPSQTPRIQWDYATPMGWRSLGVQDDTHGLTQSGLIQFLGPARFPKTLHFEHHAHWLRAQWSAGTFPLPPRLEHILTNTMWASQATTIVEEILGSSTGEPNQTFQATQFPILLGQQLEVREQDVPPEENNPGQQSGAQSPPLPTPLAEAETSGEAWIGWTPVPNFHGSGPGDRHYVIDYLSGRMMFGNGQQGMLPPRGHKNIRLARYRSGGGTRGNRPAHTITQLKSTVAYVADVTNHKAAEGGSAQEHPDRVRTRGPKTLRHRGRAVTAQDFEDLAFEASPEVVRALALTPRFDPIALEWMPTFSFALDGPGNITVTATWEGGQTLTVEIAGPGQGTPYARQTGPSPLTLTYAVAHSSVIPGDMWSVRAYNHHETPVAGGKMSIEHPFGSIGGALTVPGKSAHDIQDAGRVELIIVPRSRSVQPTPSLTLIQRLEDYIHSRGAPTVDFWITEPDWVKVTVSAVIVPQSFRLADQVRNRADAALSRFLHPLHGGVDGQGWPFGRAPHQSDIYAFLEDLDGVDHIESLVITSEPSLGGEEGSPEVTPLPKDRRHRFLIFSGDHHITMAASNDPSLSGA